MERVCKGSGENIMGFVGKLVWVFVFNDIVVWLIDFFFSFTIYFFEQFFHNIC